MMGNCFDLLHCRRRRGDRGENLFEKRVGRDVEKREKENVGKENRMCRHQLYNSNVLSTPGEQD